MMETWMKKQQMNKRLHHRISFGKEYMDTVHRLILNVS